MKRNNNRGAITVEACVIVILFMMLMFILMGLFMTFMAHSAVAHATLEAAESLSMDAWQVSKLRLNGHPESLGKIIGSLVANGFGEKDANPYFVSDKVWWQDKAALEKEVADRFLGYYAGGDANRAAALIKSTNIERNGGASWASAFDFSESKIVNGDLYIVVKYKLNYMFQIWGLENGTEVTQTAVCHLWMENSKNVSVS